MKKPYQIEAQRAVKQLEAMAAEGNPAVQMVLPMAEMVGWLRKGVGELIRQAGLQLMDLLMQEEVRGLAGERSQRQAERTASRWGTERGYCVVMGQKVPVRRPRVRSTDDKEVRLGSYEMFHRGEPLTETVWEQLMLGLSTRKYGESVRQFAGEALAQTAGVLEDATGLLEKGWPVLDTGPYCAYELNAAGGRLPESRMRYVAAKFMWRPTRNPLGMNIRLSTKTT